MKNFFKLPENRNNKISKRLVGLGTASILAWGLLLFSAFIFKFSFIYVIYSTLFATTVFASISITNGMLSLVNKSGYVPSWIGRDISVKGKQASLFGVLSIVLGIILFLVLFLLIFLLGKVLF